LWKKKKKKREAEAKSAMAASVMASLSLKPSPFTVEKSSVRGLPTLSRRTFKIEASGVKKIKTDTPYGLFLHPHKYILLLQSYPFHVMDMHAQT